jgi:hypothetical protein
MVVVPVGMVGVTAGLPVGVVGHVAGADTTVGDAAGAEVIGAEVVGAEVVGAAGSPAAAVPGVASVGQLAGGPSVVVERAGGISVGQVAGPTPPGATPPGATPLGATPRGAAPLGATPPGLAGVATVPTGRIDAPSDRLLDTDADTAGPGPRSGVVAIAATGVASTARPVVAAAKRCRARGSTAAASWAPTRPSDPGSAAVTAAARPIPNHTAIAQLAASAATPTVRSAPLLVKNSVGPAMSACS